MKQPLAFTKRLSALRLLAGRFAFGLLMVVTFGLMLLGKLDAVLMAKVQAVVADTVAPTMQVLSRPAQAAVRIFENFHDLAAIREDNVHLHEENKRLQHWQSAAMQLESENLSLKSQLRFIPDPNSEAIAARVVADTGGAFAESVLITAGQRDRVRKGSVVMSVDGLVGRIEAVGQRASRVLLLTDINSRLPVTVGENRQKAIMVGNNGPQPYLMFLHDPQNLVVGDKVVTGGESAAFPPGLAIGEVAPQTGGANRVSVALYANSTALDIVQIIDYGLTGIIDTAPVTAKNDNPIVPRRLQQSRPVPPSGGPAAVASAMARNGVVRAPGVVSATAPLTPPLPAPFAMGHQ